MPKRRLFKRKGAKAVRKERHGKTKMKELLNRSPRSAGFEISLPSEISRTMRPHFQRTDNV
jgi:hypothetical protein